MSKRYMILGLSLVLALALAVPALGGPTNPIASISASVKSTANKALKKAKAAQTTANSALAAAAAAQGDATSAGTAAKGAQSTANEAKKKAETAQTTANEAKTSAANALTAANNANANANTRLKTTEFKSASSGTPDTTAFKISAVECSAGQQVTGGGFGIGGEDDNEVTVGTEGSAFYGPGWLVTANAIAGKTPTWSLEAIAVCAHP